MTIADPASDATRAHYVAGLTQLRAGQLTAAIDSLRHALTRDPSHAGARRNLIRALAAAGDHEAIILETTEALRQAPDSAELHFLRGSACNALGRPLRAREALTTSVALNPYFAPAWLNLGNAFMDLDDLTAAEAHCRHALELDPALIEARVSLGFILTAQNRLVEATEALEAAIRADPDNVQAHWNLAATMLLAGDLPRGFAEYEWRKRHDLFRRDFINLPGPIWDGGDPNGRVILVHAEQGFGDTIQFARYLTLIARAGGTPVLACEPALIPLLTTIAGVQIVSKFAALPRYDAWIDQMSLPHVFGTTLDTIPFPAGYLRVPAELIGVHRATLPRTRRVGVAWMGNPLHRNDRRRTPPAEVFQRLTALPDCHFVSLVPDRRLPGMACPSRRLTDYAETAALIAALDLVVTVDTSIAHVAGATGCPAWVLLPYAPDWRWPLGRGNSPRVDTPWGDSPWGDSPWYGSLRVFRQPSPGDWESTIDTVIAALPGHQ